MKQMVKGWFGGGEGKVSEWQVANMSDYIFDSVLESRCLTFLNKSRNQKLSQLRGRRERNLSIIFQALIEKENHTYMRHRGRALYFSGNGRKLEFVSCRVHYNIVSS